METSADEQYNRFVKHTHIEEFVALQIAMLGRLCGHGCPTYVLLCILLIISVWVGRDSVVRSHVRNWEKL